jgi:hypothetical protein
VDILKEHPDTVDLSIRALKSCIVMVKSCSENKLHLGTKEFGNAIAVQLKNSGSNVTVVQNVCALLSTITVGNPPVIKNLGDTQVVDCLVSCVSLHVDNGDGLVESLLQAIATICPPNGENILKCVTTQTFKSLIDAMGKGSHLPDTFKRLSAFFTTICGKNDVIMSKIPAIEFSDTMNDILSNPKTPDRSLKATLVLVYFASASPSLRQDLRESGIIATLTELEVTSRQSLAKAIGACKVRLNNSSLERRDSNLSLSSELSDTDSVSSSPRRTLVNRSSTMMTDPINEEDTDSPAARKMVRKQESTGSEYGEIVASSLAAVGKRKDDAVTDPNNGRLRNSVLKVMKKKEEVGDMFRLAAFMEGMDKLYDPAIMTEIYKTSVAADNRELCLKALLRTDFIIKEAKMTKTYSPVVTNVIDNPEPLMSMLKHFLADAEVQSVGILTATRMSYASGGVDSLGTEGTFKHLYEVMTEHVGNKEVCLTAVAFGVRLTSKSQENKFRAAQYDGFKVLVSTMRSHQTEPDVVEKYCRYICSCVDRAPSNSDVFREAGGCQLMVSLILNMGVGGEISDALVVTIHNLCAQNNTSNQAFFASISNVQLYVKEMISAAKIGGQALGKFKAICGLILGLLKFPDAAVPALLAGKAPSKMMLILRNCSDKGIIVATLALIVPLCGHSKLNAQFRSNGIATHLSEFSAATDNVDIKKHCQSIIAACTSNEIVDGISSVQPEATGFNAQRQSKK